MNRAIRSDVPPGMEPLLGVEGLKLWALVEDHHESARSHLIAPTGPTMAGVVWLSAHLAATEHVVHPSLPGGPPSLAAVQADRASTRELKRGLRALERRLSGDSTAHLDTAAVIARLSDALDAHAAAELAIIRMLDHLLDCEQMRTLLSRYRDAVMHGPTRPHPHGRHTGAFEGLWFTLNKASDRVMDTVDSRPSPLPREPKADSHRPGRWSLYLLGRGLDGVDHSGQSRSDR
jgi:hypothetical protein